MQSPNEKMAAYWNEEAGPRWVALQERLDESIRELGREALEAARPMPGEAVLDVGCGCGDTLLELARRVGPSGSVLGIDLSAPMLARAQERLQALEEVPASEGRRDVRAEGFGSVRLERGDAQRRSFEAPFDLVFSRFGLMFFDEPVAAFANLRRAVRPGGRLAFVCWREREKNPWLWTAVQAASAHVELPEGPEDPHAPGPFGLHDAERLARILEESGWQEARFRDLDLSLRPGGAGSMDEAVDFALQMGPLPDMLRAASEEQCAGVRAAVREAFTPHEGPDGVRMPAAARIVTARRIE